MILVIAGESSQNDVGPNTVTRKDVSLNTLDFTSKHYRTIDNSHSIRDSKMKRDLTGEGILYLMCSAQLY